MNDTKDILSLLGLPSEQISNYDFVMDKNGDSTIIIDLLDIRDHCPRCFEQSNIIIKGYYTVKIKNSVFKHRKTLVIIRMRRYKCKKCGKTFKQKFYLARTKKHISKNTEYLIKEDLKESLTFSYIAKSHDVSINYVVNLFDSLPPQPREKLTSVICIDEFKFSSNNKEEKYPCVITNPFNGSIIDIIRSRRKVYLIDYFNRISMSERYAVSYFISDMNETYRQIKKMYFPKATHIIDRFHIAKLFTEAIQSIRIKIMKSEEYKSKEYLFLKKNWKLFIMSRKKIVNKKIVNNKTGVVYYLSDILASVLKKYNDLNTAYQAYQDFFSYGHNMMWQDAKKHLDFFINQFNFSNLKELKSIGKSLSNWYYEIINAFSRTAGYGNLSNAIAEATNDVIQTYNDAGYGYNNFDRFKNRILYINRSKRSIKKS